MTDDTHTDSGWRCLAGHYTGDWRTPTILPPCIRCQCGEFVRPENWDAHTTAPSTPLEPAGRCGGGSHLYTAGIPNCECSRRSADPARSLPVEPAGTPCAECVAELQALTDDPEFDGMSGDLGDYCPHSAPAPTEEQVHAAGRRDQERRDLLKIARLTSEVSALREAVDALTVRRVQQEDPMGCGVACLAMVSGRTYAEVRASLSPEAQFFLTAAGTSGTTDHTLVWWLHREGYWHRRSWMDAEGGRAVPTAGVALMLTHDAHWVVLVDGLVLDPARPEPLAQYNFRQAIEVLSPSHTQAARAADVDCSRSFPLTASAVTTCAARRDGAP